MTLFCVEFDSEVYADPCMPPPADKDIEAWATTMATDKRIARKRKKRRRMPAGPDQTATFRKAPRLFQCQTIARPNRSAASHVAQLASQDNRDQHGAERVRDDDDEIRSEYAVADP